MLLFSVCQRCYFVLFFLSTLFFRFSYILLAWFFSFTFFVGVVLHLLYRSVGVFLQIISHFNHVSSVSIVRRIQITYNNSSTSLLLVEAFCSHRNVFQRGCHGALLSYLTYIPLKVSPGNLFLSPIGTNRILHLEKIWRYLASAISLYSEATIKFVLIFRSRSSYYNSNLWFVTNLVCNNFWVLCYFSSF